MVQNIFGNKDALIGSIELAIGAVFVLGSFIFRKAIANDYLDRSFSVIGSSTAGCLVFLIVRSVFEKLSLKFAVVFGIIAWLIVGFLLGDIIGDGTAEGGGN